MKVYANSHKRGREDEGINGGFNQTIGSSPSPVNVLSLQTPPQITELCRLGNPQPSSNLVSTGLRLSSSDQKRAGVFDQPPSMFPLLSDGLTLHDKQCTEEIEQFLRVQVK